MVVVVVPGWPLEVDELVELEPEELLVLSTITETLPPELVDPKKPPKKPPPKPPPNPPPPPPITRDAPPPPTGGRRAGSGGTGTGASAVR